MTIKCTNANRGTFNHECGRPAAWVGVQCSRFTESGFHRQAFCQRCKLEGDEARTVIRWERPTAADEPADDTPLFDLTDAGRAYLEAHR